MITLVLGGARSGKSEVAERLAGESSDDVTYVATMRVTNDEALASRVAQHQSRRPSRWITVQVDDDLAGALNSSTGTVLIDSLGPWLAALPDMRPDLDGLTAALLGRGGDTIIVSDEVGMSVHPESPMGREFRDALGTLNQSIARVSDHVLLVVAGRVLSLPARDN
ncbi:MAG TPA: bifunctional adenosylcobinamide kinase/adenosylcobinamide-phosphate guanylyltransferase [Acidimicrobiales bacterium]